MNRLAVVCEAIAATSSKNAKVELAEYLRCVDDSDLESVAYFFTGSPFARCEQKTLSVGGGTIVAAATNVWIVSDADLAGAYREHGDLGGALSEFVRAPADLGLFSDTLTPASVKVLFEEIANAAGRAINASRRYRL